MNQNGDTPIASQITITFYTDGRVNVNGPLENKVICLGLLAVAQHQVNNYVPKRVDVVDPAIIQKFIK